LPAKKAVKKPSKKPDPVAKLRAQLAKKLKLTEKEVELRALRELAASLRLAPAPQEKPARPEAAPAAAQKPAESALPLRLYLALDGRGLDGRGMPFEVIDLPCYLGSGRKNNVWINSPRIETKHLVVTSTDEGWVVEDLGSEHGTFLGDERIQRRVVRDGDEFRLAGYLRVRAELR
jgi:hypothetical protein